MQYKIFTNTKPGRTIIDTWEPEHKTFEELLVIYRGEYAKVDEYTNEGHFVRGFYISPDEDGEMIASDADNTIFVI